MRLPEHVQVQWIGQDSDVSKLECLMKEKYIGIDAEWRPQLTPYDKTKPSLFQISGEKNAFLIDLVSLEKSRKLDDQLTEIFMNQNSIIVGFGFKSDLDQFQKKLPHLKFMHNI